MKLRTFGQAVADSLVVTVAALAQITGAAPAACVEAVLLLWLSGGQCRARQPGAASRKIEGLIVTIRFGYRPLRSGWFGGDDYIGHLVLPDFFFHISIAHGILRHLGAKIGKRDYLGNLTHQSGGDYS